MLELKSLMAFSLTLIALVLASAFVAFQVFEITVAREVCSNFSGELKLEREDVALTVGEGKLIKGNITNTGLENEYKISTEGPQWVVVRPTTTRLGTNESEDLFVYVSPEFGAKGEFRIKLVVDALCIHLEKTILAKVQ